MGSETGIKTTSFINNLGKPPDASPVHFCVFKFLKFALSKHRPTMLCGFWKALQED